MSSINTAMRSSAAESSFCFRASLSHLACFANTLSSAERISPGDRTRSDRSCSCSVLAQGRAPPAARERRRAGRPSSIYGCADPDACGRRGLQKKSWERPRPREDDEHDSSEFRHGAPITTHGIEQANGDAPICKIRVLSAPHQLTRARRTTVSGWALFK